MGGIFFARLFAEAELIPFLKDINIGKYSCKINFSVEAGKGKGVKGKWNVICLTTYKHVPRLNNCNRI